ncbi:MAG TPA: hypothetical protein PKI32_02100 [Opitutales bacterium]|nr:hypothetical protein [Opitutales bacterium]
MKLNLQHGHEKCPAPEVGGDESGHSGGSMKPFRLRMPGWRQFSQAENNFQRSVIRHWGVPNNTEFHREWFWRRLAAFRRFAVFFSQYRLMPKPCRPCANSIHAAKPVIRDVHRSIRHLRALLNRRDTPIVTDCRRPVCRNPVK